MKSPFEENSKSDIINSDKHRQRKSGGSVAVLEKHELFLIETENIDFILCLCIKYVFTRNGSKFTLCPLD